MPTNLIAHTDPLALIALGVLGVILLISIALFAWLIMAGGKKAG